MGSSLGNPNFDVERATWDFNIAIPGGSLLRINDDHWMMSGGLDAVDLIGVRWVGTFSAP